MNAAIRLFLVTENEQAENDYLKLMDYIASINEHFERNYNISVELLTIENFDIPDWQLEEEYYQPMRECDAVFFLVFTRIRSVILESFEEIWQKFKSDGKPSIYTYFFGNDDDARDNSVRDFMNHLDKHLGHYYSRYDHIDTIKLKIMELLSLQKENTIKMTFQSGHLVVDGKKVLSLENVPIYSANDNLAQLKEELTELEKDYFPMKAEYAEKQNDVDFYRRYADIASKRYSLMEEIEEAEKKLFEASLSLTKDTLRGELTPRQREAYRYLEMGSSEKANAILDAEEMNADYRRRRERRKEEARRDAVLHIREHSTKIDVLKTMTKYPERFDEIIASYEEIRWCALDEGVEYDMIRQYASFLYEQNSIEKAYDIAKELEEVYQTEDVADEDRARLLRLIGTIKRSNWLGFGYEKYYSEVYNIFERLVKENPVRYKSEYAISCGDIAIMHHKYKRFDKSEAFFIRAFEIFRYLSEENPKEFMSAYITCYTNLAVLYYTNKQVQKAEKYFMDALYITQRLISENQEVYLQDYARVCRSELVVFLFGEKAGEYTLEELSCAAEYFGETAKNKICVLSRYNPYCAEEGSALSNLAHMLDKYRLRYVQFENLESVKLTIIEKLLEQL